MKRLLAVLVLTVAASAQTHHNVLVMMDDSTFRTAKECRGLTEVVLYGTPPQPEADYAIAVAGNGHGAFEVLLFNTGGARVDHWFGTNTRKGTERACKWLRGTK